MMIYKGIARGKVVELEDQIVLPDGTEVEVVVKGPPIDQTHQRGYAEGSPQAVLAALDSPARCSPQDVQALMEAIEKGKRPLRREGIFDREDDPA